MKTFTALAVSVAFALCAAPARAAVSWSKQIYPILQKKCLGCHSDLGTKGGLNLEKRDNILKGGAKHGPAVVPGKPDAGSLIKLITTDDLKLRMPPKGKPVDKTELDLIKKWIAEGAQFDGEGSLDLGSVAYKPIPEGVIHVLCTALSPDGRLVAFGRAVGGKSRVEVWEVDTGRRAAVLEGFRDEVYSAAFAPDGRHLVAGEHLRVWVFRTADWRHLRTLEGHVERVMSLAFSKDSKVLAAGSGVESKSGFIHIWDFEQGKELRRIEAHTDEIQSLAISPDGTLVASASADKLAKLHEIATGKFVKQFAGHTHHVQGVAFNADGKQLVTGGSDNDIKLWDVEKGEQTKTAKGHTKQITGLVYKPDGKSFFTSSGDKSVREWTPTGGVAKNYGTFNDYVYGISVSADGRRIAAGSHDGVVRVYAVGGAMVREITRTTVPAPAGEAAAPMPAAKPPKTVKTPTPMPMPAPAPMPAVKAGSLIPAGAAGWKYAPAAKVAGNDWMQPKFDDSAWVVGKAPFGYGFDGVAEKKGTLTDAKAGNLYFRREFAVDAKQLTGATVRLMVASDDFASVWINGKPADEDTTKHKAMYWNRTVEVPVKLLVPGRNVIAVMMTNGINSSSGAFDLQLDIAPGK